MGFAESGHYYSFVKEREEEPENKENPNWYEFNDCIVKSFNPNDIANEAFGGEEKVLNCLFFFFIFKFFFF